MGVLQTVQNPYSHRDILKLWRPVLQIVQNPYPHSDILKLWRPVLQTVQNQYPHRDILKLWRHVLQTVQNTYPHKLKDTIDYCITPRVSSSCWDSCVSTLDPQSSGYLT